jgi:hypothetical protein
VRAEPNLNGERGFEHPRNRRPEFFEENAPAWRRFLADGVQTECDKLKTRFRARQTGRGYGGNRLGAWTSGSTQYIDLLSDLAYGAGIGVALELTGTGGSILTVPALVYIAHQSFDYRARLFV